MMVGTLFWVFPQNLTLVNSYLLSDFEDHQEFLCQLIVSIFTYTGTFTANRKFKRPRSSSPSPTPIVGPQSQHIYTKQLKLERCFTCQEQKLLPQQKHTALGPVNPSRLNITKTSFGYKECNRAYCTTGYNHWDVYKEIVNSFTVAII